nr:hypothetical protein [Tanacetum cinerariifolium]
RVENLKQDKIAQPLEIIKLKQRVKRLEKKNKLKVFGLRRLRKVRTTQRIESSVDTIIDDKEDASKQGEIIANIDADEDVTLKDVSVVAKEVEQAELQEVIEVVTTAKLMTEVVTAATTPITTTTTPITAATITDAPSAARRRKGVYFNSNVAFLEKSKEPLEEEESRAHKRTSESLKKKAAKKQKLDEEVEELKKIYRLKDLEVLWQIVKEIFTSLKPKNFSYDFLLTTLTYMFEKPDVEAQVWKNQRGIHSLAKVKSWRLIESCGVYIITFTTT